MATLICNRIGFYSFLLCGVFLAWSNISNAAETRPLVYRVEQTRMLQDLVDKSEVLHKQNYETVATTPAGQQVTRYTTRSTLFSKARLGAMTRGAFTGPLGLAITAAYLASEFIVDEQTGVITKQNPGFDSPVIGTCSQTGAADGTFMACFNRVVEMQSHRPERFPLVVTKTGQNLTIYGADRPTTAGLGIWTAPSGYTIPDLDSYAPGNTTVSDADIGDAILDDIGLATDILSDSISSGRWPTEWPEAKDTADDISDTLGQDIEGTPAQDYDDTISDGSTVTQPPLETESDIEIEFPVFCDWATIVCDFITWMQGEPEYPEDVPLPTAEIDLDDTDYDSGITVVTCPIPITVHINTFDLDLQIKWDYLCRLAEMIRPVVIAFSWLLGIYILIRVK